MYSFTSRVRFSEADRTQKMTLHSILNYFQDCSIFHSSHTHMTIDELTEHGYAWVLASWQVIINRYPRLGETIKVSTWAYGFKGFYGYRNFTLEDEAGNICAYANTIWTFLDLHAMHPAKIPVEVQNAYEFFPQYPMENAPRKISVPKDMIASEPLKVINSQIDVYQHMNNAMYVQLAQELLPEDFDILQMRAEYINAAVSGDTMYPYLAEEENRFIVAFRDENRKAFATIEFLRKGESHA